MAYNFPDTPTVGQNYQGYIWDGEKWDGTLVAGATGPTGPTGLQGLSGQQAGRIFYFASSDASDIAGYKTMLPSPSAGAEQTIATPCTGTGDVLVAAFATDPGVPGVTDYPAGTAYRDIYAMVQAGTARLHLQIFVRNLAGTETLIRDEFSNSFTNQTVAVQEWIAAVPSAGTVLVTDRLVAKLYAQRVIGPTTVTVTTYYEGTAHVSQVQTTISTGAQGATGLQGSTGPTGAAGIGSTGPTGATGTAAGGAASGITFTPAGNIAATDVQAALVELDNEKVAKAGDTMTGVLVLPNGTAALPSLTFTSGTTTGLSWTAAGLNLNTAGAIRLQLTGSGNISTVVTKGVDGAVGAPSYTFNSEATSGLYRKTTGSVSISGNNSEVMNWLGSTKTTTAFGPVLLAADPAVALQAATKQYVDVKIQVSDTPPAGAPDGALWVESDSGNMFCRINDGNSTQWVQVPAGAPAGAVRFDAAQSLTSAQQAQARSNIAVTKKNYIVNGAMQISQENSTGAGTVHGYYPVDQFYAGYAAGGAFSVVQVPNIFTPGGSSYRIRVTITTADAAVAATDQFYITQRIEGVRVADLRFGDTSAKTITIQFGCKAPAGTYSVVVMNGTLDRSYVAEYVIAAGEANTEVTKSVVIPGDVAGSWTLSTTIGLSVRWGLMAGATFQQAAGSWGTTNAVGSPNQFNFMASTSNVFELFDVSLTEGSVAPPALRQRKGRFELLQLCIAKAFELPTGTRKPNAVQLAKSARKQRFGPGIGREKCRVGGQKEAALPGLGVGQQGFRPAQFEYDLEIPAEFVVGLDEQGFQILSHRFRLPSGLRCKMSPPL